MNYGNTIFLQDGEKYQYNIDQALGNIRCINGRIAVLSLPDDPIRKMKKSQQDVETFQAAPEEGFEPPA